MNETRSARLSALRSEVDRLTSEAEALAESLEQEAVGAELLASRDVLAGVGILWETAEQLSDLYVNQTRHLVSDHLTTWQALADRRREEGWQDVVGRHVERRVRHLAEGMEQGVNVLGRQSLHACDAVKRLWGPFFAVVRRDWSRADRPPGA